MKNYSDKVSVIIPTFNRTTYLKDAIDSVLQQSYENIELIIVDDSTNDKVRNFCKTYENEIIYFNRNQRGISSALNFGIKKMTGDWYKLMADDDFLPSNSIESFLNYAKNNDAKIIYSDLEYLDEQGNGIGIRRHEDLDEKKYFEKQYWLHQIVISVCYFIHKSCFDVVGIFENGYETAFDFKWCLKALLLHDYKFHRIPKVLYKFRIHEKQSSFENAENHLRIVEKIREEIKELIQKNKPEKWDSFESYLKSDTMKPNLSGFQKNKRKFGKYIPYHLKQRFIKSSSNSDFKLMCRICNHWGRGNQTFFFVKPNQNEISCPKCDTYYNTQTLERMLKSHS